MNTCQDDSSFEVEAVIDIVFNQEKEHGTITREKAECGLKTSILGLKNDMSRKLGAAPEAQRWFYNGQLLDDDKTLKDYFGQHTNYAEAEIYVKIENV
jgi:hypothetical protein